MSNIIQVNEEKIKGELGELVRKTVEEMLNEMLDAEADEITANIGPRAHVARTFSPPFTGK